MLDLAITRKGIFDREIIRRIGKDHLGTAVPHQPGVALLGQGIAANQPMRPKEPNIAAQRYRGLGNIDVGDVVGRIRLATLALDQDIDLTRLEASDLDVEIDVDLSEKLEFLGEKSLCPSRRARQAYCRL